MNKPIMETVGDVAQVDSGPAFKSSMFSTDGEGIRLLRGDNIEPGRLRWTRTKSWPDDMIAGYEHLMVDQGDLILGMDRPVISSGLKLARVRGEDLPALLVQRVARIRPTTIDERYLYHWLSSDQFSRHLRGAATGTQLPHVTLRSIREFRVPRFGRPAENRIVTILEDHLSRLDAADAYIRAALRRLASLRERTVIDAITGAGFSDRVAADLPYAGTADGVLCSLPRGWKWSRLGEVADVVGGDTMDAKKQSDPTYAEVPYLRVANVQRGHLKLNDVATIRVPPEKAKALALVPGDVLLNEGGDRDKLARGWVWEGQIDGCIHQNHVFRARVRDPRLTPEFLSWTANTIGGRWAERNGKQSVNLASISLKLIRQMPVIVPVDGAAEAANDQLRDQLVVCDRLKRSLEAAQQRSLILRRSLLGAAFSGGLSGSDQGVEVLVEAVV